MTTHDINIHVLLTRVNILAPLLSPGSGLISHAVCTHYYAQGSSLRRVCTHRICARGSTRVHDGAPILCMMAPAFSHFVL